MTYLREQVMSQSMLKISNYGSLRDQDINTIKATIPEKDKPCPDRPPSANQTSDSYGLLPNRASQHRPNHFRRGNFQLRR
jgi:hypothetical protein